MIAADERVIAVSSKLRNRQKCVAELYSFDIAERDGSEVTIRSIGIGDNPSGQVDIKTRAIASDDELVEPSSTIHSVQTATGVDRVIATTRKDIIIAIDGEDEIISRPHIE